MAKTKSDKLTLKHIIGYGAGDCGGCIAMWMGWSYVTRFLQVHLQINAAVLATMLLVWNIWDAVNDPLMGTIMDIAFTKAKPGKDKFRPWILASIPILAVGSIGLFAIPQVISKVGDNPAGYQAAAIVGAILGGIMLFIHYAWTEERNKGISASVEKSAAEKEAEKIKLTDIFNIISKNRAFLALVLHSICICAVQALGQGAALYMYADVIGDVGMQSYYSTIMSVLMIGILSIAPFLTKKWDLVAIIRVCLLAGFVTMGSLLAYTLLVPNFNAWLFVIWLSIGEGLITMSVQMQWGLVAESIDYNEYLTGKRNEGTIYGFFSLSRRIGSTIASSASVLMIAAIGYDAALTNAGLPQAAGTIAGIKVMVVGFPLLAAIGSFSCFTFIWNINKDVRQKMAEWKAAKAG